MPHFIYSHFLCDVFCISRPHSIVRFSICKMKPGTLIIQGKKSIYILLFYIIISIMTIYLHYDKSTEVHCIFTSLPATSNYFVNKKVLFLIKNNLHFCEKPSNFPFSMPVQGFMAFLLIHFVFSTSSSLCPISQIDATCYL